MESQGPENLIKKRLQLAQEAKIIIQQLDSEQKPALKNGLKMKVKSGEIGSVGKSGHQIHGANFLKVRILHCLDQYWCGGAPDRNFEKIIFKTFT
jgi:hypothetical protein